MAVQQMVGMQRLQMPTTIKLNIRRWGQAGYLYMADNVSCYLHECWMDELFLQWI